MKYFHEFFKTKITKDIESMLFFYFLNKRNIENQGSRHNMSITMIIVNNKGDSTLLFTTMTVVDNKGD